MNKMMITLGAIAAAAVFTAHAEEMPVQEEVSVPETTEVEVAQPEVEVAQPEAAEAQPEAVAEEPVQPEAVTETADPEVVADEPVQPEAVTETADPEVVAEAAAPETAEPETAEEEDEAASLFEVSLTLDVNSAYVSHNRIFSDTPVAQYDIWGQLNLPENFGWVAVDVWASQELNKRHSSHKSYNNGGRQFGGIGEFDYEIVYGNSIGPVNLTASHLWYTYPRCGWHSQKFWTVGAEYDNEFVVPSVKFFWEYAHNNKPDEAFMIDFALSRGFELTEKLSLELVSKTTLYTSEYAKSISDGALTDTVFGGWDNGVSLSYALTDNVSLGAHLNYLYKLDHRVRHCPGWDNYSVGDSSRTHDGLLYGGVSANVAF